jgi:hypothetical protein
VGGSVAEELTHGGSDGVGGHVGGEFGGSVGVEQYHLSEQGTQVCGDCLAQLFRCRAVASCQSVVAVVPSSLSWTTPATGSKRGGTCALTTRIALDAAC